jgi:FixJ family two-component response regulator
MNETAPWVFVVDDDPSIRKALGRLLRAEWLQGRAFSSAVEFLEFERPDAPACLVLDLQMPVLDGLELQKSLSEGHIALPIIFITGHGDIPTSVRAMKAGAVDFLAKPFDVEALLQAVHQALEQDRRDRQRRSSITDIRARADALSRREREVFEYVVAGMPNKKIARRLEIKEKTVKVHRGHVMQKMQAGSLAELARMAERAGIQGSQEAAVDVASDFSDVAIDHATHAHA